MSDNTNNQNVDNTIYKKVLIEDELKTSFISYAMAVNVSRAIPDVRDGLKPVHRRILYSMGEMNLTSDKPYRKCARIVGDVMGKYHPHGDSSVYSALVRFAQDFSMRVPLVDGQGNFGSIDGDPPAAMRYTEARLTKISAEMLRDIDKETVDWYPNFDDSLQQPVVLPSRFPNLLVNGSDGIAVGMATYIPPHNLAEVISGVIALIDNPDITIDELMTYIPAPDLPTGARILGRARIRQAYRTGRGGMIIRAKSEIEEYTSGNQTRHRIVVTELPYQVNKSALIKKIADLVKDKKIDGISDIKEESDREGMRIVIEVKRDAQPQVVLNTLYKHTDMQRSSGIIMLALVDGRPKILNLKEILEHYLEHQKDVIIRRTKFDLEKSEKRAHILEGLVIAQQNIDRVVEIIKTSRDRQAAMDGLQAEFALSSEQAGAILDMRLGRLTSLEVEGLYKEREEILLQIEDYKDILARPVRVTEIIKTDLLEISQKYGTPRRTDLEVDYNELDIADLIDKEDVVVSMTHYGYIKRLPVTQYKTQHRGGSGVTAHRPKEEDFVEHMFITCTHNNLLYFTNMGKVYSTKAFEVPEAEKNSRGRAIVNLLQLDEGEKVNTIIPLEDDQEGYLIMATKKGLIKKTALSEFSSIRKVGKVAIKLLDDDELISVQLSSGNDEVLVASSNGKCIRFSEKDIRDMGRTAQGVKSMSIGKNDIIVDMIAVRPGSEVLTVSTKGYGKRTDSDDYRLQSRGGKGVKAGVFNEKTGHLVNLKQVNEDDDVMVITDTGIIIRMNACEIPRIGRATQGVRLMRIKEQGNVVCVAIAQPLEDDLDLEE